MLIDKIIKSFVMMKFYYGNWKTKMLKEKQINPFQQTVIGLCLSYVLLVACFNCLYTFPSK